MANKEEKKDSVNWWINHMINILKGPIKASSTGDLPWFSLCPFNLRDPFGQDWIEIGSRVTFKGSWSGAEIVNLN